MTAKMASYSNGASKLRFSQCTCPICLYILIKPVTFPCGHELCLACFSQHVMKTSLLCPLCRVRISVWVRRATRENKLVNEKRWEEIQNAFPEKVKNRLEGKEAEEIDEDFEGDYYVPQIAEPGELRKEFEEQRGFVDQNWLSKQRAEEEASLRLIAELMKEEAKREEQERKDAELAAALSKQINESSPSVMHTPSAKSKPKQSPSSCSRKSKTKLNHRHTSTHDRLHQEQGHLKMWYKTKSQEPALSPEPAPTSRKRLCLQSTNF